MTAGDFTLSGYRGLLEGLLTTGYRASRFDDVDPHSRDVILRHDLDMSLEAALPIAETEQSLGLSATYFVLLRSEFYNVLSPRSRAAMTRILDLGHALGLHFDAALYESADARGLDAAAAAECDILEKIIERPIRLISFHRPAAALLGREAPLAGRDHTYRPRYFSEIGYCSDSRGGWHHGHPLEHPALAAGRALQLLTHPLWWNGAPGEDPVAKLDRFVGERQQRLERALSENCQPYRDRFDAE